MVFTSGRGFPLPFSRKFALLACVLCMSALTLGCGIMARRGQASQPPLPQQATKQRTIPQMLVEINSHLDQRSAPS